MKINFFPGPKFYNSSDSKIFAINFPLSFIWINILSGMLKRILKALFK